MESNLKIYLAEDDEDDALFFRQAFQKTVPQGQIKVYANGEELMKEIRSGESVPAYIFLDINMPMMNGIDTLVNLKASPQTALIPTFMFSSSDYTVNIQRAYQLGATSYFTKPQKNTDIVRMAETFKAYWDSVTKLPVEK